MLLKDVKKMVKDNATISYVFQEKPYTFARILFTDEEGVAHIGEAVAKLNPKMDEWDAERGAQIAVGRAQTKIARKLFKTQNRWNVFVDPRGMDTNWISVGSYSDNVSGEIPF